MGNKVCVVVVESTMETESIDGKNKYKLKIQFNTSWSEPTQPFHRNEKWRREENV